MPQPWTNGQMAGHSEAGIGKGAEAMAQGKGYEGGVEVIVTEDNVFCLKVSPD